jgi:hypothetical protein
MGLEQRKKITYLTIFEGKFAIRVEANTPGAVSRTNKLGKVVHEIFFDQFSGLLVGISTKESADYGKSWVFEFRDGNETFQLQTSYSSSTASRILKTLPNVQLSHPMTLVSSMKMVDGKNKTSLFILQHGNPIKQAYTREVPNGLPEMESLIVKGNQVWDDTKQLAFLAAMIEKDIIPNLPKMEPVAAASEMYDLLPEEEAAEPEDKPF